MTSESSPPRALYLMGPFGFLSGLPLSLTAFTLQLWFTTFGISVHSIAMTAWLGLPYTLKFLWSGFFDRLPPGPLAAMGRRRGWLMIVQPLLAAAALAVALSNPAHAPAATIIAGLCMAFFSASQDILIDAWRIETFPERLQGTALAVYMWSYRGAMLTSTTGVTFIAHYAGWHTALATMAAILMAGMLVTLAAPHVAALSQAIRLPGWRAEVEASVLAPLRDFLSRPGAMTVLAFVLLFKLGKVMADVSAAAFYHEGVGFSTSVIGAANAWGWAGTLGGAAVGGWLVHRRPTLQVLFVTGLCQAASLGLYAALLLTGPNEIALIGKMVLENFASTCADMAFLTYLSSLCSRAFTATQYALLSSLPSVAFHTVGGLAGYAAEALGYPLFYAATIAASFPALAILLQLRRRFALAAA